MVPAEATNPAVGWSCSDLAVATVSSDGLVSAVAVGEATITASAGDASATCVVEVGPGVYVGGAVDSSGIKSAGVSTARVKPFKPNTASLSYSVTSSSWTSHSSYERDAQGSILRQLSYSRNSLLPSVIYYDYDAYRHTIKTRSYSAAGELSSYSVFALDLQRL